MTDTEEKKPFRMVSCYECGKKNFISGDLKPLELVACGQCGGPVMMPRRLRHIELRAPIASGGMGTVYRAFDSTLERYVAVKLMKPELAEDSEALEAFYREARACAGLNHTNIIHIYSFDQEGDERYLVMEIADRGSLDSRIEKEKVVSELDVLDVGISVSSALDKALAHNLLHRDIKPGNILFNEEGEPKLVDFGLAKKADSDEEDSDLWGTPYYIAPEKVERKKETFLSDMYSLAGTMYHALTGHVPFEAPTIEDIVAAHIHTPLTHIMDVNPNLTPQTGDAIMQAMSKSPEERHQSYDDFIMALTAARSHLLVNYYNVTES